MNIKINKEQFLELDKLTIGKFLIGSHLYNLSNENSDTDYLCIFIPTMKMLTNPFENHHQFQYKDEVNNIDYIFVDIKNFIKNIVSGDSTINFELLHSKELEANDNLRFLYQMRKEFYLYNVARSYLGLARRDIKYFDKKKTLQEKNNALCHIIRGNNFASDIINGAEINLDLIHLAHYKNATDIDKLNWIGNKKLNNYINSNLRDKLNVLLGLKSIQKQLTVNSQDYINWRVKDLIGMNRYIDINKSIEIQLLNLIYQANVDGKINY